MSILTKWNEPMLFESLIYDGKVLTSILAGTMYIEALQSTLRCLFHVSWRIKEYLTLITHNTAFKIFPIVFNAVHDNRADDKLDRAIHVSFHLVFAADQSQTFSVIYQQM
jgi:hypothetical protein